MINKYYDLIFYKRHIEIKINPLPELNFNRNKLF